MAGKRTTTREKVVMTAIQLANSQGIEQLSLTSIARELGIRVPSLYNHVDGMNGLIEDIRFWGMSELNAALRDAAVGKAGDDALRSMAHAYRTFAHANRGIYPLTLKAVQPDEVELDKAAQELLGLLVQVLGHYQLDREESIHVIRIFRSILHGYIDLEIAGGFEMPQSRDESFRRLVELFIAGLRSQSS